jgi:hypothetical protein
VSGPVWANTLGGIFVALGIASALTIVVDVLVLGYRQQMAVMNVVHPVTALYLGPVWLWLYFTRARRSSTKWIEREAERLDQSQVDLDALKRQASSTEGDDLTRWNVADAVSHCGAGCTLGDIIGEWIVFATGWTIAGATLYAELILDFVFAWTLGVAFQYFTIVPMRNEVGRLQGLWLAIRADTASIVSFQVGLFAWMILSAKVLWSPPLPIDSTAHWWMMQVGMILGFATAWPVNRWLIRRSWKEKMDYRRHLATMLEPSPERPQSGRLAA